MVIYPYMNGSKSARALADGLGIKILKREGVRRKVDVLINWGSSNPDRELEFKQVLNKWMSVYYASNKLRTFEAFKEQNVPTVEWTTDRHEAIEWVKQGHSVVIRNKLIGHSGEGIDIVEPADGENAITVAPLYTKYTKKKDEYRIHVFQGEVIFQQRKARKKDVPDEEVNWQVRNLAGGFIFANDGVAAPDSVQQAAIAAVKALGLDFGAADVGFKDGDAVVYEVNCAPGLVNSSLKAYIDKFRQLM